MNVDAVKLYCQDLAGSTEHESKEPSNVLSHKVGGKPFAYFKTSSPEKWRFSLRVTPERFIELTEQTGIKPARYMQRFHWITIVRVASFNADYLKVLINWSYEKALSSLSKKQQLQIKNELRV